MSLPLPRGRLQWGLTGLCVALVAVVVLVGAWGAGDGVAREASIKSGFPDLCAEERKANEEQREIHKGIVERHDERCEEKLATKDDTISALESRIRPCCPEGCEKRLAYKDWRYESQTAYYKKWIKLHCGKWIEPTDAELKAFAEEEDDDGDDGDDEDTRW